MCVCVCVCVCVRVQVSVLHKTVSPNTIAWPSAGVVEYTDCISAEE